MFPLKNKLWYSFDIEIFRPSFFSHLLFTSSSIKNFILRRDLSSKIRRWADLNGKEEMTAVPIQTDR